MMLVKMNGSYFEVDGDFTEYANNIVVGYKYDFEVELPKFFTLEILKVLKQTTLLT